MDYEKKYKEALERAKEIKSKILLSHLSTESCKAVSEYIDTIIPELAESEDERIRKELIRVFRESGWTNLSENLTIEEAIAYLEKQKEPHYTKRNALFDKCVKECDPAIMKTVSGEIDDMLRKEQKPTQEQPSEDLEEEIKRYIPRDQCPVPDLMEAVARHFAEWQKDQMRKAWRTAKAGKALQEDCLIIYQGEEARLGRVAVYDCHYLPVSDLTKYLKKED